jgi:hypothetical protein
MQEYMYIIKSASNKGGFWHAELAAQVLETPQIWQYMKSSAELQSHLAKLACNLRK